MDWARTDENASERTPLEARAPLCKASMTCTGVHILRNNGLKRKKGVTAIACKSHEAKISPN